MPTSWSLQDAKNRFSELARRAEAEGPQFVTRHGREAVVVMSAEEYRRLVAPKEDLASFLSRSPLAGLELDLERDDSPARELEL
ncbi:type II toxin-antitoxin system Phd/YefM family antitoxin [Oceanithermus sp.]